jgi:hypothetical protein
LATRPYPAPESNRDSPTYKAGAVTVRASGACSRSAGFQPPGSSFAQPGVTSPNKVSKAGIEPASSHVSGGRPCLLDHSDMAIPPGFEPGPSSLGGSRPSSWTMGPRYRRKESNLLLVIHSHALLHMSFASTTRVRPEKTLVHTGDRGPCSDTRRARIHALQLALPILSRIAVPPEGIEPPWPLRDDGVTARPLSINVYGGMVCVEGFEPPILLAPNQAPLPDWASRRWWVDSESNRDERIFGPRPFHFGYLPVSMPWVLPPQPSTQWGLVYLLPLEVWKPWFRRGSGPPARSAALGIEAPRMGIEPISTPVDSRVATQ